MPTKFPFIGGITLNWVTVTNFLAFVLMKMSHRKPILTQVSPGCIKEYLYFIEQVNSPENTIRQTLLFIRA